MKRVLVVDDSIAVRIEVSRILSQGGFAVVEATDGLDAVDRYKSQGPFDFVLIDFNMPNMDGIEASRLIKQIAAESKAPSPAIAMLTTESNSLLKAKGKEVGIVVWIVKPVNATGLLTIAKKLCNL